MRSRSGDSSTPNGVSSIRPGALSDEGDGVRSGETRFESSVRSVRGAIGTTDPTRSTNTPRKERRESGGFEPAQQEGEPDDERDVSDDIGRRRSPFAAGCDDGGRLADETRSAMIFDGAADQEEPRTDERGEHAGGKDLGRIRQWSGIGDIRSPRLVLERVDAVLGCSLDQPLLARLAGSSVSTSTGERIMFPHSVQEPS
ncbi:hypothetical protein BRC68_13315 [Halobacteriales archaeon QH_6_64_20]|nr:MAG: hypothetical protein BRC68_13315 [Halobacteriales archaeon QH_6_64_20]